jgi:hypothetical protein
MGQQGYSNARQHACHKRPPAAQQRGCVDMQLLAAAMPAATCSAANSIAMSSPHSINTNGARTSSAHPQQELPDVM